MQAVHINGAEIAYRIEGSLKAPLIITLHGGRGFGNHAGDFKAYSPLSDAYRVLSFDMRGHGESSVTGPFTFQQLTDDIHALRQHFAGEMGKVIILGGSFGGYLAQQYTIQLLKLRDSLQNATIHCANSVGQYPQHVSQLILRGTAPSWHHEDGALKRLTERLSKAPLASKEMLVDGVFDKFECDEHFRLVMFALGPLYSEATYDPNASLEGNLKTKFRAEVHNDLYSPSQKHFDYRASLKDLATPTLVIVGEKDWICPPDESRAIADAVANSKLVIVENANHGVHLEQNKLVLDCIRGFLGAS